MPTDIYRSIHTWTETKHSLVHVKQIMTKHMSRKFCQMITNRWTLRETETHRSPQEDHAHSGDGGRGGRAQIMRLKQEVDVGPKLDSLSGGHGQETVVIQHWVERLHPLWVNVTVTDNPGLDLWNTNKCECRGSEEIIFSSLPSFSSSSPVFESYLISHSGHQGSGSCILCQEKTARQTDEADSWTTNKRTHVP